MHHRKDFSEDEELGFFYMLDKICIIDDILKGNADKYWMDVQYPDDWLPNELEGTTSLSPSRQRIISKLLDYVTKGDWKAPASVGGIQTFIKDVLGVGEPIREPEMQKKSEELWSLLEQGRGDRVVIVMQNLIGYFVSREWLSGGSPALNKAFFGNDDNYSNIDKGNPNRKGTSEKFEYIMPLLDATQIRNLKLH